MMKKNLGWIVLSVFYISSLSAQERYQDSIFAAIAKQSLIYDDTLGMDVYSPQKDKEKLRPLLLYVHGGAFAVGKRDEEAYNQFCRAFAYKGYVAATMSYTLVMKGKSFSCDQPAPNKIETFRLTANDISRAVAYLIQNHQQLGIDTNRIVLLGSSAGAEAILHAAYWNASRITPSGQKILSEKFRYAGIVSLAGALVSLDFIREENAIPTQLFHGTCDNLVPYAAAPHHYCDVSAPGYLPLYGGYAIAERLKSLGKSYYLVTACKGGHEWAGIPLSQNLTEISDFLYKDVLQKAQIRQIHTILATNKPDCSSYPSFNYCK
ncbi:MAG: alpha/beta hydrolase [Microscillaceae bacterium]|nr:alpha/beta hydrolase [Microscillaceae bacterium]